MRENAAFVKNIHAFFLKCNYFSNSFATFKQPQIVGRGLPLMSSSYLEHDCLSYLYRQWHIYYGLQLQCLILIINYTVNHEKCYHSYCNPYSVLFRAVTSRRKPLSFYENQIDLAPPHQNFKNCWVNSLKKDLCKKDFRDFCSKLTL